MEQIYRIYLVLLVCKENKNAEAFSARIAAAADEGKTPFIHTSKL